MMNVPCMVHAAKSARTPTGHTDVAAQKDTFCSLTGYLAMPDKVSCIIFKQDNLRSLQISFFTNKQASFCESKWDSSYSPIRVH